MRTVYEERVENAREIERRIRRGDDKIVGAQNWVWFAKYLWPDKTAAHLATIAKSSTRTAERWLSGEFEPPGVVMALLISKLFERG